jgi:hypothetical protein
VSVIVVYLVVTPYTGILITDTDILEEYVVSVFVCGIINFEELAQL